MKKLIQTSIIFFLGLQLATANDVSSLIMGFNPAVDVTELVTKSSLKPQAQTVGNFNDGIIHGKAPDLQKLVRTETPLTVRLLGSDLIKNSTKSGKFNQIGLVIGDPHDFNWNTQANYFSDKGPILNRYTLVDLDEVTVGVFKGDLARYLIYLTAQHGDLTARFGKNFVDEFFESYLKGLRQEPQEANKIPAFISKQLQASSKDIMEKAKEYAESRIESISAKDEKDEDVFGKFKKGEYSKFEVENIQPGFLSATNYVKQKKKEDEKEANKKYEKWLKGVLKNAVVDSYKDVGEVQVFDFAIPEKGGGSADMQRFVVSARVNYKDKWHFVIIEFKQNSNKAGWDAVVESPSQSTAERYNLGIDATMDDRGYFLEVFDIKNTDVSFLMRPRGNLDIKFDEENSTQRRELALFNAYMQGLFHGGQGKKVSEPYLMEVSQHPKDFQEEVYQLAMTTLKALSDESGLKVPKAKKGE